MHEESFAGVSPVRTRFDRCGRRGEAVVACGRTPTPEASGFAALSGWEEEREAGVGFPTIKASARSDRPGYLATFGWLQWVVQRYPGGRSVRLVDRPPSLLDRDLPFAAVGYEPTFFDAPAYNRLPAVDWDATLFLTTLPILSRREPVVPLAGFRWGYRIRRTGSAPVARPLSRATAADWRRVRGEVGRRHRRWRFATTYVDGPPRGEAGSTSR